MPYSPPRRTTSLPATISVVGAQVQPGEFPAWIPDPGKFENMYRADQPTAWHDARLINPDYYTADGSPSPYPLLFSHSSYGANPPAAGAFYMMWRQQCGADFNYELGAHGSLLIMGGGHVTWGGCTVIRFDVATGMWSQMGDTIYSNTERIITGGTVAAATGTVIVGYRSDGPPTNVPDHVDQRGNYRKTADDVLIPSGGLTNGNGAVAPYHPYPVHTNRGICVLPSEAGGGPKGSLLIHGHSQTGITTSSTLWCVYKFNCDTLIWDHQWLVGDNMTNSRPEPTLTYDSRRKIVWERGGSGSAQALNYLTGTKHVIGPSVNVSDGYIPGFCYMPTRDLMVVIITSRAGTSTAGVSWAQRDGAPWLDGNGNVVPPNTPGANLQGEGCYGYPRIWAFSLSGYAFGKSWTASTLNELTTSPTADSYRDALDSGLSNAPGWPKDYGTMIMGGGWGWHLEAGVPLNQQADNGRLRAINDGFDYCEAEDCLTLVERGYPGTDEGVPRANNTFIRLWKLRPPAIGSEFTQPWTWESEDLLEQVPAGAGQVVTGGAAIAKLAEMPVWGGKCKYIPNLGVMTLTDRPYLPVQALRSVDWPDASLPVDSALKVAADSIPSTAGTGAWLAFKGLKSGTSTVGALEYTVTHSVSGKLCDITEDGRSADHHTSIDWASQGAYDHYLKRVMWLGSGEGGQYTASPNGGCAFNTLAMYDEKTDSWSATRGIRGTNVPATAASIAHQYGGNCFHPYERKLFKKVFAASTYLKYNTVSGLAENQFQYTNSGKNEVSNGDGSMDFVTSRGRIWIRSRRSSDNHPAVWELASTFAFSTMLYGEGDLGTGAYSSNAGSPLSFNPRAFGGVGGVFVGTPSCFVIQADPALVARDMTKVFNYSAGAPDTRGFDWPLDGHVCHDPIGDGWIYASTDGYLYRLTSAGVWSQLIQQPANMRSGQPGVFNMIMVPIDDYGVIWMIMNSKGVGADRAWIYKPPST